MHRVLRMSAIALLALLMVAPMSFAQNRDRDDWDHDGDVDRPPVIIIHRGYYYNPWVYDPWWYDPFYNPYYVPYYTPKTGEVKLETHMKDARVYVDGGYAGTAHDMKKFTLKLGTHRIELRDNEGHVLFHETISVIAGKTTKIDTGKERG